LTVWLEHVLKLWAKTLTVSYSYKYNSFAYDRYVASVVSAFDMYNKMGFDVVFDIFALTITDAE
jgi:hypothetical protein